MAESNGCSWRILMSGEKGVSLIEVLITTLIIVGTLVGVLQAYIYSVYLSQLNRDMTIALDDANDMMESIRSTEFANLLTDYPDGLADGPAGNSYASLAGGYLLSGETITVTYTDTGAVPLEILVSVSWGDMKMVSRTLALTTMRSQ